MKHHQHIAELGPLLGSFGIRHVIICPGSRNAPLTQLFTSLDAFECYSIVDERSAGYMALGMARQLQEPVVVLSTSGTAVLNLAPAVAEAHHQCIPLVVITADRPTEKIPSFNNQWINQEAPFYAFSKAFYGLALQVNCPEDMDQTLNQVEKVLASALSQPPGPVHLNIPLEEPLYENLPPSMDPGRTRQQVPNEGGESYWSGTLGPETRIMILAGMASPDPELAKVIEGLSESRQLVIIAENIANLPGGISISQPEFILSGTGSGQRKALEPDLLLSFGGQVVSKRLKLFLQALPDLVHHHMEGGVASSLEKLTVELSAIKGTTLAGNYRSLWKHEEARALSSLDKKVEGLEFGKLSVIHDAMKAAPTGSVIHLGNSSAIRYSQVLPQRDDLSYYSNRGTSGIDGCVSAAVGAAMVSEYLHLLLVGDLSFVYDSNALWNKDFPSNLKIVVLNDGGGGIFRLIDGPSRMAFFEEFSVTHHPVSHGLLAQAFGRPFLSATGREKTGSALASLLSPESTFSVLEVDLTGTENSRIFKHFLE